MNRRAFALAALAAAVAPAGARAARRAPRAMPWAGFPRHDLDLVREVVTRAHTSAEGVQELVERTPELAKAAWDWGFGDWETPLGAASHTGQREIALYLLGHGARPTLFSAAMLGQLAVVRAHVEAQPGIQGTAGPHGITLLRHARAGGDAAAEVVRYLEEVGGADAAPAVPAVDEATRASLVGTYVYGDSEGEAFAIEDRNGSLWIRHGADARRGLTHLGDRVFHPAGAPSVRFAIRQGVLELSYGGVTLSASRR